MWCNVSKGNTQYHERARPCSCERHCHAADRLARDGGPLEATLVYADQASIIYLPLAQFEARKRPSQQLARVRLSLLPKLQLDLLITQLPRLCSKHCSDLRLAHRFLLADGHQVVRQIVVVFTDKPDCDHEKIDIMEDERFAVGIEMLLLKEVNRLLSPVTQRVQMVSCVISVVEREAVALIRGQQSESGSYWSRCLLARR